MTVILRVLTESANNAAKDHDFNPSFDDVKTSIGMIPDLLCPRKERIHGISQSREGGRRAINMTIIVDSNVDGTNPTS